MQRHHRAEYQTLVLEKPSCSKSSQGSGRFSDYGRAREVKQTQFPHALQVSVNITGEAVVNACVELVTTSGRPLRVINDPGFRKIIDPVLEGLNQRMTVRTENHEWLKKQKKQENLFHSCFKIILFR